jgi:hypothetical protein
MNAYVQKILLTLLFAGSVLSVMGCEEEGPAERAGERVDESMEKAGEELEQAGDKVQDSAN